MAEANPQSLPTRTPPITDLENILRNCIYITLQPKAEPSEVSTYLDIDIYLIERMFLTEESYLEGILRNTSNPDYACCDIGQNDTIGKIELNPSIILSSDNTNCKNDIQLFH